MRADLLEYAARDLDKLQNAKDELDVFYALPRASSAAFALGKYEQAETLARQTLALAPSQSDDWNYGNAIHAGHTVLGLVSLTRNDIAEATSRLAQAGATPGSPQLDSFGPSMQLAKALAERGETEAVLAYLQQCRRFWEMGMDWLDIWEEKLRRGVVPNFPMHLHR